MAAELLGLESDRQLVERVLATRDESALLTIVLRHGTMVYHVCRRVLRHPQDAEDAFQATFLVLAQELRGLRQHSSLAGWLHGVALRVSRKAKARAVVRRRWEAGAARPEAVPPDDLAWGEVRSILDAELSRLSDKWRLPLVLCHLEGQTQDEAANQLGWSKSTLRRRLEEARVALGRRLKGRGIAWSAVLPAVLASDSLVATAVPLTCVDSMVAAALAVVNGKSLALTASAKVVVLTEGVRKTMLVKKIGIIAGALIVLTLVTAVVGGHLSAAHAEPTDVPPGSGSQGPVGPEEGPTVPVRLVPLRERTSARAEEPEPKKDEPKKDEPKKESELKKEPEPLTLKGHTGEVLGVGFSPDGKHIVTGAGTFRRGTPPVPGEVKVWDAEKGTEILALKGHTNAVRSVCFSPDGKRIASAGLDQTVRVWDAEKGQELLVLQGHTAIVPGVCFSPDGKRIASASGDKTVRVWDAEKGQELLALKGHTASVLRVCFNPDGKRIASARFD